MTKGSWLAKYLCQIALLSKTFLMYIIPGIGSIAMMLGLTIKGVDAQRGTEQAHAMRGAECE